MFEERTYLDKDLNMMLDNPKFRDYYHYLIEINQVMNLTRITEPNEVYYKHFYDSIILAKHLDLKNKTLLDVGAGAGFPSIPLKIVEDSLHVTIIDSLQKRIGFLENLKELLGLSGVDPVHGRAEEFKKLNSFDIVTSRAVARLNILTEITLPFVKVGGRMVAYKSVNHEEELQEAMNAIATLGGELEKVVEYTISEDEKHVLIIIKKIKQTKSIYPRNFGRIKNKPL